MPKKQNVNSSRRNFLAGSATVAGAAAAASVMPISIANANHTAADAKGLPSWTSWKKKECPNYPFGQRNGNSPRCNW